MVQRRKITGRMIAVIAVAIMTATVFCMPEAALAKAKKPTKVKGVTTTVSYDSVTVKWKKAKRAKKYEVFRAESQDGEYTKIATTSSKKKVCKDTDRTLGTTYWYKVRAVSKKGKKGAMSAAVSGTPALKKPSLSVVASTTSYVELEIDGTVPGADGYVFYRDGAQIAEQNSLDTYKDKTAPLGQEVTYTVKAYRTVNGKKVFSETSNARKATRAKVQLDIELKPEWYPPGLKEHLNVGDRFTIKGRITSNVDIRQVTAGVKNRATGDWMTRVKKTVKDYDTDTTLNGGNPKEFRILKQCDPYVHFGELPAGNYNYQVIVTLTDGTKSIMVDQDFEVVDPYSSDVEVTGGAKRITEKAIELAWPYGTATSVYKYKGGNPTDAYKAALDAVFPNRSGWGSKPKKGASCDVFVGTVVRASGYDPTFPRGLSDVESHMDLYPNRWEKHTDIRTADAMQPGDVVYMRWTNNGTKYGHIMIYVGNGKVANAHYGSGGKYGIIESASSQIRTNSGGRKVKKFYVYRPIL